MESFVQPCPACPFCCDGHGEPLCVTLRGQSRTVSYFCPACHQRWDHTRDDKLPAERMNGWQPERERQSRP
jgi:hypothetical protein